MSLLFHSFFVLKKRLRRILSYLVKNEVTCEARYLVRSNVNKEEVKLEKAKF